MQKGKMSELKVEIDNGDTFRRDISSRISSEVGILATYNQIDKLAEQLAKLEEERMLLEARSSTSDRDYARLGSVGVIDAQILELTAALKALEFEISVD